MITRKNIFLNHTSWICAAGLLVALLLTMSAAMAQQQQSQQSPTYPSPDLAQQNLSRVAASAQQILDVLRKDPGLLVELKRWVAKEATDRGQIVEDRDLTDAAVFDRISQDTEFRSVATRLLQRYGYLIPQLNPDSEQAKENEIARQERIRRLEREALEPPVSRAAGPEGGVSRTSERDAQPARRSPLPAGPLPVTPDRTLEQPGDRLQRAESGGTRDALREQLLAQRNPLEDPEIRSRLLQQAGLTTAELDPMRQPAGGSTGPGAQRTGPLASGEWDRGAGFAPRMEETAGDFSSPPTYQRRTRPLPGQREPGAAPDSPFVSRANPYADIPSLYELYRQVSPRGGELQRFGFDVFRTGVRDPELLPTDLPVGPDYVVGPGDGLSVDLWGAVSQRIVRNVDAEGRISLPEVGPVLVSGRSLGDVQRSIQQILRTQFRDVSADVSLSRLRTIRVYVVGDVEQPGAYDISSLSTPLNALFAAGGPATNGSLRTAKHYRGKTLVQEVDLYDLLLRGVRSDMKRLENGDTVLVPPMRPQVTVEGAVRRPAIYELREEKSLAEVLDLAGGILPTATLRQIHVQRVEQHQKRTMFSLDLTDTSDAAQVRKQLESFGVQDGDEIRIFPIGAANLDAVYLQGHVLRPGRYSYREGMRLGDLVGSFSDLLPEPAAKYAEIIRLNAPDYRPAVESFDLAAALANPPASPVLKPMDTVRIFSRYDFEYAPTVWVGGEVRQPGQYRTSGQIHLRDAIHLAGGTTPDAQTDYAQVFRYLPDSKLKIFSVNLSEALAGNPIDNILLEARDRIVVHRNPAKVDPPSSYVKGEVAKPGRYPLTTNMTVADLIRLAGGLRRSAYLDQADLTRYLSEDSQQQVGEHKEISIAAALAGEPGHNLPLRDGDTLTIRQIPGWNDIGASVVLRGEVQHPGTYGIRPGERLSSILERAGGFLATAYPQGSVLMRREVFELQTRSKEDLIRRIEQDAANINVSLDTSGSEAAALTQAAIQQRERVLQGLRQTPVSGRLVIRLQRDLSNLAGSPDDIELRDGDTLLVPKRPDFVVVTGQVYNSNAITFMPRKNVGWYLKRAGGPTGLADAKRIFVIRASGEVVSGTSSGWWGGIESERVEPGDTIVVPEKPIGASTFWKNFLSVAQVATQSAIATAVITR